MYLRRNILGRYSHMAGIARWEEDCLDRSTSWWPAVLFTRWRSPAAGHAWTCGNNSYSQLGVGDSTDRLVPTVAPVAPAKFEVSKSEGSKPYCKTQEQVLLHTQT